MPPAPRVILVNPHLTHGGAQQMVQGMSGRTYGVSHWSADHGCHIVELTTEKYEAAWKDLHAAITLPMRGWYPHFVMPPVPNAVMEFHAGYNLAMDGQRYPDDASPSAIAGWHAAHAESQTATPAISRKTPYMKLRKLAKDAGVWRDGMRNAEIRAALGVTI